MLNTTLYPFWGQTHLFNLVPNVSLPDAVQHEGGGNGGKEKKTSEQGWGWLVELLLFGKRCIAAKLWSDSVLLHIEPFWGPLDGMVKRKWFNEILEIHATKGHQPKQATTFQGIYLILRERKRWEISDGNKKKQRCYQVGWAVSGFDALNSLTILTLELPWVTKTEFLLTVSI